MTEKKMGRPTDNPKTEKITVRLDEEAKNTLKKYCNQENISRVEGIRRGVKKLKEDLK